VGRAYHFVGSEERLLAASWRGDENGGKLSVVRKMGQRDTHGERPVFINQRFVVELQDGDRPDRAELGAILARRVGDRSLR
jgi:hypothetical protein